MGAGASLTFGGGTLSELDAKQQIGVCYDLDAEAVFHTYAVSDDGVLVGDDEPVFLATLIRLVGGGVIAPFRLPAGLVEPTLVPLTVMGAGGFFSVCNNFSSFWRFNCKIIFIHFNFVF